MEPEQNVFRMLKHRSETDWGLIEWIAIDDICRQQGMVVAANSAQSRPCIQGIGAYGDWKEVGL